MLEVVEPGLLTTVQDAGRPDAIDLGVPIGGACDPLALTVANLLAGNEPSAAAIEMTLLGASFVAIEECVVAVSGADMGALSPGQNRRLRRGERLDFGAAREASGIRTYLALAGGIDVPVVIGSRSTCLVGRFGGLDGRPLRAGDVVRPGARAPAIERQLPARLPTPGSADGAVRVVRGPDADSAGEAFAALLAARWTVSGRGDRQGIRLDGPALGADRVGGSLLSRGVSWGTVQLPPDGHPIVLLADHQTVGGYLVPAVTISADRPVIGQLGPGDEVSFVEVSLAQAQRLRREQAADIERLATALR